MCNQAFDAARPPFEAACQGYDKDDLLDNAEDAWGAFRAIDDLAEVASTHIHTLEHVWWTTPSDTMFVEFFKHHPPSFKGGSVPLETREDIQSFTMYIEPKVSWLIIDGK